MNQPGEKNPAGDRHCIDADHLPIFNMCLRFAFVVALLASTTTACKSGMSAETQLRAPAERTVVAPVFEHGEGYDHEACFVCLDESEALTLIREVLARYGYTRLGDGRVFPELVYETRHGHPKYGADYWRPYGVFEEIGDMPWFLPQLSNRWDFESTTQYKRELKVDLYDTASTIAIEFVSAYDASEIVAFKHRSGKRPGPFQTKAAAEILATAARDLKGPRFVAFFYDPLSSHEVRLSRSLPNSHKSSERQTTEQESALDRLNRERTEAQTNSRRLLELQVIDFAEWLGAQQVGDPCRTHTGKAKVFPYRLNYPDGSVRADGGYCGGEKHGVWTRWYAGGELMDRGEYDQGLEFGLWDYRHPNGFVRKIGEYRNGKKHGPWVEFSQSGILMESAVFDAGEPSGAYYHRVDEKTDSVITADFPDGEVRIIADETWVFRLKNGRAQGPGTGVQRYLVSQGNFVRGQPEGRWTTTGPGGCPEATGNYLNGRREGTWIGEVFDQSTDSCVKIKEVSYKNGVPHGYQYSDSYYDCVGEEGNWVDGQPDGVWIFREVDYDPLDHPENPYSCNLRGIEEYKLGQRHGHWVSKWSNGCVESEGEYQNGEKDGLWIYGNIRNPNGECYIEKESNYKAGRLNGVQTWHYEGNGRGLGIRLDNEGLEPALIETEYSNNRIVGVRKFWLRNGRYYRECEFGTSPIQPDELRLRIIPDFVEPPRSGNWGDSNMSPPIPARCRMWLMPENLLIEDGEFVATSHETMSLAGSLKTWHQNGRPRFILPSSDDSAVSCYSSGKIKSEGAYLKSKKHGPWTRWYENGRLRERGEYEQGVRVGRWTHWFENGTVSKEGEYGDWPTGQPRGVWVYRYPTGQKKAEADFGLGYSNSPRMECWDASGEKTDCDWKEWRSNFENKTGWKKEFMEDD